MKKLHIEITFIEPVLGTASNNPEIHDEYIASKVPDAESREEEIARLGADTVAEKSPQRSFTGMMTATRSSGTIRLRASSKNPAVCFSA